MRAVEGFSHARELGDCLLGSIDVCEMVREEGMMSVLLEEGIDLDGVGSD